MPCTMNHGQQFFHRVIFHTNYPREMVLAPGGRLHRILKAVGPDRLEVWDNVTVQQSIEVEGKGNVAFDSIFHANDYFRLMILHE